MDVSDIVRLLLLGLALVLSAFFSASEAAFLSVRRSRMASLDRQGVKGAARVSRIARSPEKLLPTVLTGNNLVNVAAAALGTTLAASYLTPNWAVVASTAGVTVLLLLFAEVLPKTIATKRPESLALFAVGPLQVAELLFFPAVWLLERFSRLTARLLKASEPVPLTEADVRALIGIAETEGAVDKLEAEMLEKVFHFGDRQVQEIMTPRMEIVWVQQGMTLEEFLRIYAQETHTRFPVFQGDMENVVGVLSVKDLLQTMAQDGLQPESSVTDVLRPAYLVPETKLIGQLFSELREAGQQMAVVVNEYSGVAGLVTLKRLLEVIVGPVGEEGEPAEEEFATIGENTYDVDAGMGIQEANDELKLDLPEGNYQTLAGFILERLGHIPQEGEQLYYKDLCLEVTEMKQVKIERVLIRFLSNSDEAIAGVASTTTDRFDAQGKETDQ